MRWRLSNKGHSMTEYVLPVALVALAAIASLGILAQDLIGGFSSMEPKLAAKNASNPSANPTNVAQSPANPSEVTIAEVKPDVSNATLSTFTSNLQQSIESNGANGTTDLLSMQLTALSKQLLAEGKIDEAGANLLQALANGGHEVASAEKALEDAYLSGSSTVSYQGKSYPITEFTSKQMSFSIFPNGSNIPVVTENTILNSTKGGDLGPVMGNFIGLYQDALKNKALQDPAVRQQVSDLVVKIAAIEAAVGFGTESIYGEKKSGTPDQQLKNMTVSMLKDLGQVDDIHSPNYGSTMTHGNSASICVANGKGNDTGTHCKN